MSADGYKYNYPEKVRPEAKNIVAALIAIGLFFVILGVWGVQLIFVLLIVLIVVLIKLLSVTRTLEIHPRYLICGSKVMYFETVQEVRYNEPSGTLTLSYHDGRSQNRLVIERERFPTNARKPEKIANNKAEKFRRVSDKIREHIRQRAPQAVEV